MYCNRLTNLLLILLTLFSSGCAVKSSDVSDDSISTMVQSIDYPHPYQQNNNAYINYQRNIGGIYYNHNSAIGYGGVNVYNYQGV